MGGIKGITTIDTEFAKAEVKGHFRTYKKTGKRFYVDPFARNDQARALARDLASDNWHTRTMAKMKTLPIESLEYIARDATEAAVAGETIGNPKAGQYRDEAHYANMEIQKRKKWAPGTEGPIESKRSIANILRDAPSSYPDDYNPFRKQTGLSAPGKYVGGPIQFPKRFKTNGDITKFIIKITKTHAHDPEAVKDAAKSALRQFPLSSNKMIYDGDLKAMDPEMRRVVLEAAVETDNAKYEGRKSFEESLGLKPTGEAFGRSDVQKTGKLASPGKYEGIDWEAWKEEAAEQKQGKMSEEEYERKREGQVGNVGTLFDSIRPGDRVTIVNRFGQKRTGRVVMRGPAGWVLNLGGPHGTPGIASPENVVGVKHGGGGVALRAPSSYVEEGKKSKGPGAWVEDAKESGWWNDPKMLEGYLEDMKYDYHTATTGTHRADYADELQRDIGFVEHRLQELKGESGLSAPKKYSKEAERWGTEALVSQTTQKQELIKQAKELGFTIKDYSWDTTKLLDPDKKNEIHKVEILVSQPDMPVAEGLGYEEQTKAYQAQWDKRQSDFGKMKALIDIAKKMGWKVTRKAFDSIYQKGEYDKAVKKFRQGHLAIWLTRDAVVPIPEEIQTGRFGTIPASIGKALEIQEAFIWKRLGRDAVDEVVKAGKLGMKWRHHKSPEAEEKIINRWESSGGKHWVELIQTSSGFKYKAPDAGGYLAAQDKEAALKEIKTKLDSGYFLPDAAKKPTQEITKADDVRYVIMPKTPLEDSIVKGRGKDQKPRKKRSKWSSTSGWNKPEKSEPNYGVKDSGVWANILNIKKAQQEDIAKADVAQTFLAYIAKNPDPPDKAIHALADKLGIEHDKFEARIYGILSDVIEHGKDGPQPDKKQLAMGIKVESEHTKHTLLAEFIARAHLKEIPDYYSRLKVMEDTSKAKPTVHTNPVQKAEHKSQWTQQRTGKLVTAHRRKILPTRSLFDAANEETLRRVLEQARRLSLSPSLKHRPDKQMEFEKIANEAETELNRISTMVRKRGEQEEKELAGQGKLLSSEKKWKNFETTGSYKAIQIQKDFMEKARTPGA